MMDPVFIEPRFEERVWGVADAGPWAAGQDRADGGTLGEAWLTDLSCAIGPGQTLGELIERDPADALGDAAGSPPILVKLLFTSAPLSVQVHPTDQAAQAGGLAPTGKNEAWFVLSAAPDAGVWIGFEAPVASATLSAAVADGSVLELMHRRPVCVGDTVAVPAGTVHAIGPGLVLLEVQDPVQITYRLFDHGRPRPLQIAEAMEVATLGPVAGHQPDPPSAPLLVQAPRFVLERHELRHGLMVRPDAHRAHIVVALSADVKLDGRTLRQGNAAFVPARGRAVELGAADGAVAVVHAGPGTTPCIGPA